MCFEQYEDLSENKNNLHSLVKLGIVGRGGRGEIKFKFGGSVVVGEGCRRVGVIAKKF